MLAKTLRSSQIHHFEAEYPFPIAYAYRLMENSSNPQTKFFRLFDIFEITLKYLTIIAICDYLANNKREDSIEHLLGKHRPSIGHWHRIFREILAQYHDNPKDLFIPQLYSFYHNQDRSYTNNRQISDKIISFRNKYKGHGATLPQKDYSMWVDELRPMVDEFLSGLGLLADNRLILVRNLKYRGERFQHEINLCMGSHTEFALDSIACDIPLEYGRFVLINRQQNATLSLYPFVIYAEAGEDAKEEIFFLEANIDNKKLEYLCYQNGHRLRSDKYLYDYLKLLGHETTGIEIKKGIEVLESFPQQKRKSVQVNKDSFFMSFMLWSSLAVLFVVSFSQPFYKLFSSMKPPPAIVKTEINYGNFYFNKKMYDESIIEFAKSLQNNPDDPITHYYLGQAYEAKGLIDAALKEYKTSSQLDPNFILAHKKIEELYGRQLAKDEKLKQIEKTHDLKTIIEMGNVFYDSGNYNKALAYYQRALKQNPRGVNLLVDLGTTYNQLRMTDLAIKAFKDALAIDPNHTIAHYNLGVVYDNDNNRQKDEAIQEYKKVLQLNPNFAPAYYALGVIYIELGFTDYARQTLTKFIDISPPNMWTKRAMKRLRELERSTVEQTSVKTGPADTSR